MANCPCNQCENNLTIIKWLKMQNRTLKLQPSDDPHSWSSLSLSPESVTDNLCRTTDDPQTHPVVSSSPNNHFLIREIFEACDQDDRLTQLAKHPPFLLPLASLSAPLHDDGALTRHGAFNPALSAGPEPSRGSGSSSTNPSLSQLLYLVSPTTRVINAAEGADQERVPIFTPPFLPARAAVSRR